MIHKLIYLLLVVVIISSCKPKPCCDCVNCPPTPMQIPVKVFKYKNNTYHGLVRVAYSTTTNSVVGAWLPQDYADSNKIETKLINGYWQDIMGDMYPDFYDGTQPAITSITWAQYAAYTNAPSLSYLTSKVIDTSPFSEYYNCSNLVISASGDTAQLNNLIRTNKLNQCNP